jgi:hypothetical protein
MPPTATTATPEFSCLSPIPTTSHREISTLSDQKKLRLAWKLMHTMPPALLWRWQRSIFTADLAFGLTSERFGEFVRRGQYATDIAFLKFNLPLTEKQPPEVEAFRQAVCQVTGLVYDNELLMRISHYPWHTLRFADRFKMESGEITYVDYIRQATSISLEAKGKIDFYLAEFDFRRHFLDIAIFEEDRQQDLCDYIESASYLDIAGEVAGLIARSPGKIPEMMAAGTWPPLERPRIAYTTVELTDFLEGKQQHVPVTFLDRLDKPLDTERFRRAYWTARLAMKSEACRKHLAAHGIPSPDAEAAIAAVIDLVAGKSEEL